MRNITALGFLCVVLFCAVVVFAGRNKEMPPWMEDITTDGRSAYLIPKGAKRKIVGPRSLLNNSQANRP